MVAGGDREGAASGMGERMSRDDGLVKLDKAWFYEVKGRRRIARHIEWTSEGFFLRPFREDEEGLWAEEGVKVDAEIALDALGTGEFKLCIEVGGEWRLYEETDQGIDIDGGYYG